ncbi:uncharacterized protein misp3 [Gouania willdenowi]|uniref:uncharacterized protein misp3 n=1 Tax=Gouania willdenowi TaxID=441366 RepID=UPI00105624E8|nr:uncharacterized protein LOC114472201 [Gouania willdenowi]
MAWQEQGSFSSFEEWVSNSQLQRGEENEAPKADPEEDIDILEPGAEVSFLQENQGISIITIIDATIMELAGNTQSKPEEVTQNIPRQTEKTEEEPEECVDLCDDEFPPPPSLDSNQICEIKAFSSFECNLVEPTSEAGVIFDPMQVITSQSNQNVKEFRNMADLTEPFEEVDTFFNEITAEEDVTQMNVLSENFCFSQSERLSEPAHLSNSNTNSSNNMNPGDNDQEENEVSSGFVFCQQQLGKQDVCNISQPSQYLSTSEEPKSTQHADPSAQQQEEQLSQSQNELAPRGENQETAQQVFSQGSPPLSNVAMELSNQGGAASYNSGCVAALRGGHGKAEGRTEEGNVPTGEDTRQGEEEFEKNDPTTQEAEGLLSYSQTEKYRCGVSHEKESHTRLGNDSWDNSQSDNGVSTDFFSFCPMEDGTCTSTGMTAAISKETPIEREIRRHLEREHSLRRARGLPCPPTSPLFVEIPLRINGPVQPLPAKAEQNQDKDREFAGKMMQHEIHGEIQREQDLVKLGKVPGVYDKGTVRQIKERKLIFETFQTRSDSTLSTPMKSKASSWSSDSKVSSPENQGNLPKQASPIEGSSVWRSQDLWSPTHSSNSARGERMTKPAPRGPGFSEGAGFQVIILENDVTVPAQKSYMGRPEAEPNNAVNFEKTYIPSFREDEEEEEKPKENPFFKLRSSDTFVKVKQDIQETEERERELRNQRMSLYRGIKGGDGKGTPIQEEEKTSISSIPPINGQNTSDAPGLSFRSGPPTAHHSVGTSNLRLPANTEERKMTCPEGLQSSCSRSQKTPLVQRWESGMLNGHSKEDH